MCVISRYGSIVSAPATPYTAPTVPEFSVLTGGIGVKGFYIIMQAGVKGLSSFSCVTDVFFMCEPFSVVHE